MLFRALVLFVALGISQEAHAVDVGVSYGLPVFDLSGLTGGGGAGGVGVGPAGLPTLDLYFGAVRLRIDALDTLDLLVSDPTTPYLGADVWFVPVTQDLSGSWEAIAGVGGSVGLVLDPSIIEVAAIAPIGIECGDDARVGLYLQPTLGVISSSGNTTVGASASFLGAIWF